MSPTYNKPTQEQIEKLKEFIPKKYNPKNIITGGNVEEKTKDSGEKVYVVKRKKYSGVKSVSDNIEDEDVIETDVEPDKKPLSSPAPWDVQTLLNRPLYVSETANISPGRPLASMSPDERDIILRYIRTGESTPYPPSSASGGSMAGITAVQGASSLERIDLARRNINNMRDSLLSQYNNIDPNSSYSFNGKVISGVEAKNILKERIDALDVENQGLINQRYNIVESSQEQQSIISGFPLESIYEPTGEDSFNVLTPDMIVNLKEEELYKTKREELVERMTGKMGGGPAVLEEIRFITGAFIHPGDIGAIISNIITGDSERIIDIYAKQVYDFESKDIPSLFFESYKPGGWGFLATSAASLVGINSLLGSIGAATGAGGMIVAENLPWVVGGAMSSIVGAELGLNKALEDMGELPPGSTAELIGRRSAELAVMAGAGIVASRSTPFIEREIVETKIDNYTKSYQSRIRLFDKPIFSSKEFFVLEPVSNIGLDIKNIPMLSRMGSAPSSIYDTPIISISQIKGSSKITYRPEYNEFNVEKIVNNNIMKPFDTVFKPPIKNIKSPIDALYKSKTIDLFEKILFKPIQKTLDDFIKGSFYVTFNNVDVLEKTINLKGFKPLVSKESTESKSIYDIDLYKSNKDIESRYIKQKQDAYDKLMSWKSLSLKDIIKRSPKQSQLPGFERIIDKSMKPFKPFEPPIHKPMSIEDIYNKISKQSLDEYLGRGKPTVNKNKLVQTSLYDLLFKSSIENIIVSLKPRPIGKKPFDFAKQDITKPVGSNNIVLEKTYVKTKGDVSQIGGDFSGGTSQVSMDVLRDIGRFESDSYIRSSSIGNMLSDNKPGRGDVNVPLVFQGDIFSGRSKLKKDVLSSNINMNDMSQFENSLIKQIQQQDSYNVSNVIQNQLSDQMQRQEYKQVQIQDNIFEQIKTPIFSLIYDYINTTTSKPPSSIITPSIDIPVMSIDSIEKSMGLSNNQAYNVFVYKRQYANGRRIRGRQEMKINDNALNLLDAKSLGSNLTDKSAKRTFIIKPSDSKPHKLNKRVQSWDDCWFEYSDKGNGRFVETNKYAIDSPGEIEEITMRGIDARRNRKNPSKTNNVLKDIDIVNRKVNKMFNRRFR